MKPEELERLTASEFFMDRLRVARERKCPPEILARLAKHDYFSEVRAAVARNTNTPFFVLKKLSGDENEDVRAAAREQLEQRQRESACADYEAGQQMEGMGYEVDYETGRTGTAGE